MAGGGYDLEAIRQRADIVEIISPHVALRKRGKRLVGLCPFHQERTPSFTVDPETGLWHCFGCKAGGDLFRFVEMIEKVTFAEAVEHLARRLGVAPRQPADAARQRQRDRLLELHEEAERFFQAQLQTRLGKKALSYIEHRGVSSQAIDDFALGYAPDSWDSLLKAMEKRGFPGEELVRAGLAAPREGGFYDRFRDRLLFPIRDAGGRVVAFGGRALSEEQTPKYLNSPETPIFQKGRLLYGFDRARQAMGQAERAIVVEGYLDVIACHEGGFAETVATMGTALTADHVEVLRRRVPQLLLAFDSDSAGMTAALRARELFAAAALSVRVVTVPEGADPDEVIRNQGPEAFRALVDDALPMMEWELTRILAKAEGGDDRARMETFQEATSALGRLPAGVEREYYIRWLSGQWSSNFAGQISVVESAVRDQLARDSARKGGGGRRMKRTAPNEEPVKKQAPGRPPAGRLQAGLLAAFLTEGDLAARHAPKLEPEDFTTEEQRSVFAAICRLLDGGEAITPQTVLAELAPEARGALAELAMSEVSPENAGEAAESAVRRLVESRLLRREAGLRQRLEQAGSESDREAILRDLSESRRQRSELAGQRIVGET